MRRYQLTNSQNTPGHGLRGNFIQPSVESNTDIKSVAEVILLCVAGYILSKAGVTDKATQRKLNVINVSLFTPALLFSKVSFALFGHTETDVRLRSH